MAESKDNIDKRIYRFYTNRVITNKHVIATRVIYCKSFSIHKVHLRPRVLATVSSNY